jgi:uncharacterized membrane protein
LEGLNSKWGDFHFAAHKFSLASSMAEKHYRSLTKAVSWRLTGSLDTLIITFLVTGKLKWAFTISGVELFTKIFLYYVHERVWHKITWGKTTERPNYEI